MITTLDELFVVGRDKTFIEVWRRPDTAAESVDPVTVARVAQMTFNAPERADFVHIALGAHELYLVPLSFDLVIIAIGTRDWNLGMIIHEMGERREQFRTALAQDGLTGEAKEIKDSERIKNISLKKPRPSDNLPPHASPAARMRADSINLRWKRD